MEREYGMTEQGSVQWKYQIYLVGFPDVVGSSTTIPVVEMINSLVPEARVWQHSIFRDHEASEAQDEDAADEVEPEPNETNEIPTPVSDNKPDPNGETPEISPASETHKQETSISEVDHANDASSIPRDELEVPMEEQARKEPIESSKSVTTVTAHDFFSSAWITREALDLLGRIQEHAPTENGSDRNTVVLAGYGFGGIVVKQAIIIANTTPRFYDVALNVASIVFFATPHRSTGRLAWEEALLNMLRETKTVYQGRLSQILSDLVDSVSHLSHVFYKYAAKYRTTNFIESKNVEEQETTKLNDSEEVISWPEIGPHSLSLFATDDLNKLELLRKHFVPCHVLFNEHEGITKNFTGVSQEEINNTYFEALQSLSPSRWILYETTISLDRPDDFNDQRQIYRSLLRHARLKKIRGGSIQVTAPAGYGKSALMKLVSQKLRQESSIVIIDNFINSSESQTKSLYGVYASFIHQIISQRPLLFRPVQNLMLEIIGQNLWTEETLRALLLSIFLHSQDVDFLVVIYDFESWSDEVQSWWLEIQDIIPKSCGSVCTFLTGSRKLIEKLTPAKTFPLDLTKKYKQYRDDFIKAKISHLLDRNYGLTSLKDGLGENFKDQIISSAQSFQGSFSVINTYVVYLFQTFKLTSLNAIEKNISDGPATEEKFYEEHIMLVIDLPRNIFYWATQTLSWLLLAARPFRIEELAAATAIGGGYSSISQIRATMSMEMERDLRTHLGAFVAIENQYVRLISPVARKLLSDDVVKEDLFLDNHVRLTLVCLHYLRVVLDNDEPDIWEKCLSQVSYKHQKRIPREPVLEFLDYACQFWPTHFLRIDHPSEHVKKEVARFLNTPKVAQKWFQLHLLCTSLPFSPLSDDDEASAKTDSAKEVASTVTENVELVAAKDTKPTATKEVGSAGTGEPKPTDGPEVEKEIGPTVTTENGQGAEPLTGESTEPLSTDKDEQEVEPKVVEDNDSPEIKEADEEPSAAEIAGYVGLSSILPYLLPSDKAANALKTVHVRRGYSERDVVFWDTSSRSYLECAILNDDDGVVKGLLETDQERITKLFPLHKAALAGRLKTVQVLFNMLDDPAQADQEGQTPLHMAAICGNPNVIRFLIGKDLPEGLQRRTGVANMIDIQNEDDETPLVIATRMGNVNAAKLLAASGVNLKIKDVTGRTAMHYAILNCPQVIEEFLAQDEDVAYIDDNDGCTPLHIAARSGDVHSTSTIVKIVRASGRLIEAVDAYDKQVKTPLHYAAEYGYTEVAEILAREGESRRDKKGRLPAELAAAYGHLTTLKAITRGELGIGDQLLAAASHTGQLLVVEYLLQNKVSPNGAKSSDRIPLSEAASNGHNQVVRTLLRYKANIDLEDSNRRTPLHHAATNGMYDVARTLLSHKANTSEAANINAPDSLRHTPLHCAAKAGKVRVLELLLDKKANARARSTSRETPLHLAVESLEAVEVLLKADVELDARDSLDQTPLHMAVSKECLESAKLLIARGADINARDDEWRFPGYYAIRQNNLSMVKEIFKREPMEKLPDLTWDVLELSVNSNMLDIFKYLIGEFPDAVKMKSTNDRTLFHLAARGNSVEFLTFLHEPGSDVDLPSGSGETPLHEAAAAGQVENMKKLLGWGAKVDKPDHSGDTPLHAAAGQDIVEAVSILLEANAPVDALGSEKQAPLCVAAYSNRLKNVEELLKHGADVNLAGDDGWSALHGAADSLEVTELLVKYNPDINCKTNDQWTPLYLATYWNSPSVVEFLLEAGANPNIADSNGNTAMHRALSCSELKTVKVFLEYDGSNAVDLSKPNVDGLTAIQLAIKYCPSEIVQKLLEKGADYTVKTEDGLSCLGMAIRESSPEKLAFLLAVESPPALGKSWEKKDLVDAYWMIIEKKQAEGLPGLIKKDPSLLNVVSKEGFNGLETYLRRETLKRRDPLLPICFLDLGLDPFKRRDGQKSSFELGLISRRTLGTKFFNACVQKVPEIPSALDFGFRELRIATEVEEPLLWKKLESVKKEAEEETDQDDWRIDHFLYQAAPRLSLAEWSQAALYMPTKTPKALVKLTLWNPPDIYSESRVQILPSKLEAIFEADGRANNIATDDICIRADFPFPPRKLGLAYFEISIQKPESTAEPSNSKPLEPTVSIGFSGEFSNQLWAHVGWNIWSAGYHGDDGKFFEHGKPAYPTNRGYGIGNTVGFGIDYDSNKYFSTLDGAVVCEMSSKVIFRKLYPTIGHHAGACKIKVNFGETDFLWAGAKNLNRKEPRVEDVV